LTKAAHEELMSFARERPEVTSRVVVRLDFSAYRAILRAAEENAVDLIVIGSHGYRGLDRVLGTTAGRVANLAQHNVFVVHAGKTGAASG
jgi:nucleotide-binding universal stress UspA family protein